MNTISVRKILEFARTHENSRSSLMAWYKIAKKARWESLAELRKIYPHADLVGRFTVFNIKGNHYRLIAEINYKYQEILIRHILTHSEYDKEKWKR